MESGGSADAGVSARTRLCRGSHSTESVTAGEQDLGLSSPAETAGAAFGKGDAAEDADKRHDVEEVKLLADD